MVNLSRTDLRQNCRKVLLVAGTLASFTPTSKDDQAVALLQSLIDDDDKFCQLCDLLGLPIEEEDK